MLATRSAWESPRSGAMAADDGDWPFEEELYGGENRQIHLRLGRFIRNRHSQSSMPHTLYSTPVWSTCV